MQSHSTTAATKAPKRNKRARQPSVAAILKEAYRLYVRDPHTRMAVRACLGT